jgi:RNA polymerase II-associated protein 2
MKPTKGPSRGILKPSPGQPGSNTHKNRETALFHARLIHQQKDMELQILASIEALLELPNSLPADPTLPSDSDTASFKSSLRLFRASDYDDLIEERNIEQKCGYALCPRPCRPEDMSIKYRILRGNRGPNIVETRKMQKWCSKSCARHALYVRIQLSEEPAWLRPSNATWELELLSEAQPKITPAQMSSETLEERMLQLKLDQGDNVAGDTSDLAVLAVERGQPSKQSNTSLMDFTLKENINDNPQATAPKLRTGHIDSIEGYAPRGLENSLPDEDDDMLGSL